MYLICPVAGPGAWLLEDLQGGLFHEDHATDEVTQGETTRRGCYEDV